MKSLFLLLILFTFSVAVTSAADIIVLDETVNDLEVKANHYDILETGREKKFAEVIKSQFSQNEKGIDYLENPETVTWLKIRLRNLVAQRFVFEVYTLHTDDIRIYIPDGKGRYSVKKSGQLLDFKMRDDYRVLNFVFELPVFEKGKEYDLYVRVRSKDNVPFNFHIKSQSYFTNYTVQEYYFLGFYYGILFIMAIYNFLLFIRAREKVYLYYVLYVLSCMFYSFASDGLGFQFIWPSFPEVNTAFSYYVTPVIFMVTFLIYSRSFLNVERDKLGRYMLLSGLVYVVYLPFEIFVLPVEYHLNELFIVPFVAVYVVGWIRFRKGYKPARFFLLGYTFVLISVILVFLRNFEIVPVASGLIEIIFAYAFNIGIVLETLILSYALADRFKTLKEDNERAQQKIIHQLQENEKLSEKVNRELETKVAERTSELNQSKQHLEEANIKLEQLTEELNVMNAKLDYDNWQLNKQIKEETKARVLTQELSYKEFRKSFPDDVACLSFLVESKWGKGFKCKKCNGESYTERAKLKSRKCNTCGTIESALIGTLYQGVRFDLSKAFYITYSCATSGSVKTIDTLSEELELTRNTCWKFRKKVVERIDKMEGNYTWEELIL